MQQSSQARIGAWGHGGASASIGGHFSRQSSMHGCTPQASSYGLQQLAQQSQAAAMNAHWMGSGSSSSFGWPAQFSFEPGSLLPSIPDELRPTMPSVASPPEGWKPPEVAWSKLHKFEAVHEESLLLIELPPQIHSTPMVLEKSRDFQNSHNMSCNFIEDCTPELRSPNQEDEKNDRRRFLDHRDDSISSDAVPQSALQPFLRAPLTSCGQKSGSTLTFADLQHGVHNAWRALSNSWEAMAGSWCVAEINHPSPRTPRANRLRSLPRSMKHPQDVFSWSVRTSPPFSAAAQKGGVASAISAFRVDSPGGPAVNSPPLVLGPGNAARHNQGESQPWIPISAGRNCSLSRENETCIEKFVVDRVERVMSDTELLHTMGLSRSSIASLKGNKSTSPNQDRGMYASLDNGAVELLAVFDGHGECGHVVADASLEVLPKLLLQLLAGMGVASPHEYADEFSSPIPNPQDACSFSSDLREGTCQAFEGLHSMLEALTARRISVDSSDNCSHSPALTSQLDARTSGTTASVVLSLPCRLLVAHVGDSRVVFGKRRRCDSSGPWTAVGLTRDHKPDLPEERARIEEAGAQVMSIGVPPHTTHRVFTPHQTWPAINMSRSVGDLHAHTQGLSASAEVSLIDHPWDPETEDAVIIVCSDGVWDVIDTATAVELVWHYGSADAATGLVREAYERWAGRRLQGGYSDDITAVVKFF